MHPTNEATSLIRTFQGRVAGLEEVHLESRLNADKVHLELLYPGLWQFSPWGNSLLLWQSMIIVLPDKQLQFS